MLHQYQRWLQMFQWDFGIPLEVLHLAILTKVPRMNVQVARLVTKAPTLYLKTNITKPKWTKPWTLRVLILRMGVKEGVGYGNPSLTFMQNKTSFTGMMHFILYMFSKSIRNTFSNLLERLKCKFFLYGKLLHSK